MRSMFTTRTGVKWRVARAWPALVPALVAAACDTMAPADPGNLVPATVAENAALPAISMNGALFHVETFGDPSNPVIVFLHGGPGGDYRGMLRLAEQFGGYSLVDEYFLVFWDQRGSGLSQRVGRSTLTIEQYVADLDALIDRYSPDAPVTLIGESWGGMFATRYINDRPQRVAAAVLIEPGPVDGATMERLKDDIIDARLGSEWLNDVAWSGQFLSPDDHARMDYERMIGSRDAQPRFGLSRSNPSPVWRLGAAAARYVAEDGQNSRGVYDYDFTTNLDAYATPVLFIAGSWSEILGESLQQQQVHHYPSASLEVVNGAGHDVAWVKPADVITHIRAYLDARKEGN